MSIFRKEVLEFQESNIKGTTLNVVDNQSIIFLSFCLTFIVLICIFCISVPFNDVVKSEGVITPKLGVSKVYAETNGYIEKIYVSNSDIVKLGQKLFKVSINKINQTSTIYNTEIIKNSKEALRRLLLEKDMAQKAYYEKIDDLSQSLIAKKRELKIHIKYFEQLDKKIALFNGQAEKMRSNSKYISNNEVIDKEVSIINAKTEYFNTEIAIINLKNIIQSFPLEQTKEERSLASKNLDIDIKIREIENQLLTLKRNSSYIVVSPVSGKVHGLNESIGEYVDNTFPILKITPNKQEFIAKIAIPANAIGQIKNGMSVKVKIKGYPHYKYGYVKGSLKNIDRVLFSPQEFKSENIVNYAYYYAYVDMPSVLIDVNGEEHDIYSGMAVDIDIVKDRKTIAQSILNNMLERY